jgi:hypothetical protein
MHHSTILIELHYLPCIAYFTYLTAFGKVVIDLSEGYDKQSYRNRCRINGANKVEDLIIPVRKGRQHLAYSDIEIDYNQKWLNTHLRGLQSAYGKAPFYEYYAEELFEVFLQKPPLLVDLNKNLLTKCLELLELQIDVDFCYHVDEYAENAFYNAKKALRPKKSWQNDRLFRPTKYFQVFGKDFVENLSIVDLIFCEGPNSKQIIKNSAASNRQI